MKKRNFKSLSLGKESVSKLESLSLHGGHDTRITFTCPQTIIGDTCIDCYYSVPCNTNTPVCYLADNSYGMC